VLKGYSAGVWAQQKICLEALDLKHVRIPKMDTLQDIILHTGSVLLFWPPRRSPPPKN
jgi:hypothetical protein